MTFDRTTTEMTALAIIDDNGVRHYPALRESKRREFTVIVKHCDWIPMDPRSMELAAHPVTCLACVALGPSSFSIHTTIVPVEPSSGSYP